MSFTAKSRIWTVRHYKAFAPFKKYIISPRQYAFVMQAYQIKQLQWFFPLPVESTVNALNTMCERIDKGQTLFYSLPNKDTGIYAFTIGQDRPFVLILPGGGYNNVFAFVEGYTTAIKLNELGYNAFIGQYRVGKNAHYPNPQDDVAEMIQWIFLNAKRLGVNTKDYAVCGFSAGGHLAASWATKQLGYEKYKLPKPKAVMLAYPVITMGEHTHPGSRKKLLGKDYQNKEIQKMYSIEGLVDSDYPATYLWQCKKDSIVPFVNSQMFAEVLKKYNCHYEYLSVDGSGHGLGLGEGTPAEGWLEKAIALWQKEEL